MKRQELAMPPKSVGLSWKEAVPRAPWGTRCRAARTLTLWLAWLALLAAPICADDSPLPDLPLPDLQRFEPDVREQLSQLHADAARSDHTGSADAYGALGEAYLAYELPRDADAALEAASTLDPGEPRWPYLRALAALETGDRELAVHHFDETLRRRPDHLQTLLRSASTLLDLGRLDEAAEHFRAADSALGDSNLPGMRAALHFGRGRLAAERDHHEEAAAEFRRALEFQPGADGTYYHLARSLVRLGQRDAARQAMDLRGETVPYFRDPWLAAMKRRAAGGQADVLRGLKALKAGRLGEAESALRSALESSPGEVEALVGLARIHAQRGEGDATETLYRRALDADPESVQVLLNLGALLASRGEGGDEALELFRRATLADPRSASAHFNLGLELLRRGQTDEGERALQNALELRPGDAPALEALARSQAGRRDFPAAAATYAELVRAVPDRADVRFGLALALTLGGRCAEARPVLGEAVARFGPADPATGALTGLLARVLAACPDDDARDGDRAVELALPRFQASPGVETGRTLGMALAEAGRFDEAAQHLRRLLDAASRAGASAALPVLRRELASYERGEPVRSPWE